MASASEKKVLVIDDEPDVRQFLATCIKDAGFQVDTASDGIQALEKVKSDMPDLMTLDMVMPRESGIKLMRKLRKNKEWADIPVIVITAHARDEFGSDDIKEFKAFTARHQAKCILEKPITPASIVKAICGILEVEPEEPEISPEKNELKSMINNCDADTLARIRDMLNKK
ncbi:MAG: response regulator [Deltaproteobacteria bacterium]|nr:response regulator [Deltaproteobacteria bacterium]